MRLKVEIEKYETCVKLKKILAHREFETFFNGRFRPRCIHNGTKGNANLLRYTDVEYMSYFFFFAKSCMLCKKLYETIKVQQHETHEKVMNATLQK